MPSLVTKPTHTLNPSDPPLPGSAAPDAAAAYRLALLSIEGVGRVTAHRVLARFPAPDALAATPLEQVLVRLKGAPRAAQIAGRLSDSALVSEAVDRAAGEVAALASRRVVALTEAGAVHVLRFGPGLPAGGPPLTTVRAQDIACFPKGDDVMRIVLVAGDDVVELGPDAA